MPPQKMMMPEPEPERQQPRSGFKSFYRRVTKRRDPPKPPPPPRTPSGGDEREEGGPLSLPEFMRQMTSGMQGSPWEGTEFLGEQTTKEEADDFADLFWSLLVSSLDVRYSITGSLRVEIDNLLSRSRYVIVGYNSEVGYRRDLLVMVPSSLIQPVAIPARIYAKPAEHQQIGFEIDTLNRFRDTPRAQVFQERISFFGNFYEYDQYAAFRGFVQQIGAAIVLAPEPSLIMHAAVPSPPLSIASPTGGAKSSSAGVLAMNGSGEVGVTVAYHALQIANAPGYLGQRVDVNGRTGDVISIDPISDSAFVRLHTGITGIPARSFKSVRVNPAPGYGQIAEFEGCSSGLKKTVVTGSSPSLLVRHPAVQRQVFTDPDTSGGDSGCALVDDTGQLIGFCFGGSGTSSPIMFSLWIWADSVFQAHSLK